MAGTLTIVPTGGLGFLTTWGLGFKGEDVVCYFVRRGGQPVISLMLGPSELKHTKGKYHSATGHSKPKKPELIT